MKRLAFTFTLFLFLMACATHTHVVGNGPSTGLTEKKRQYYALYGLIPLNKVDSKAMAGNTSDYKIETGTMGVDYLIGAVGTYFTITSRTVTVTK